MKMKPKIILGSTAIAAIAVLITTVGIAWVVNKLATTSLQNEIQNRLILQRDMQKDRIELYLSDINEEVRASARFNTSFSSALVDFSNAFTQFSSSSSTVADREAVKNYYQQFSERFTTLNGGEKPVDIDEVLAKADQYTLALQSAYTGNNPHPLGDKDNLAALEENDRSYAMIHEKYHPLIKEYKEQWGFYDVFLVEAKTGYIVYSVEKELDYATSLNAGYYAESGLGQAFKLALADNKQNKSYLAPMEPYYPSYNNFASFVSSPLYVDGELKGVFIVQMPLDKINNIMTFNKQWEQYGLGKSGKTYLVADDGTMRNNSRFLTEDIKGYLTSLKNSGVEQETLDTIANKKTSIGLQVVNTSGSESALKGKSGFEIFKDYQGVSVLSAYRPLHIQGVNWAILAEINEEEAFAAIADIKQKVILSAVAIGAGLILLSILTSFLFASRLVSPINYFQSVMQRFNAGEETVRVNAKGGDEIAELAQTFDKLLDERVQTLQSISDENDALNESVIGMLYVASELSKGDLTVKMTVNEDVTGTLADSLNLVMEQTGKTLNLVKETAKEVTISSDKVEQQANTVLNVSEQELIVIRKTTEELNSSSESLQQIVQLAKQCDISANANIVATDSVKENVLASVEGMNAIQEEITETEKRIKRLSERSGEIASITDIIQNIAERTHVLALNANMHATVAGDAGRGFAGVADEIQRLAENASEATDKIDLLVKNIQADTADTMKTMQLTINHVEEGNKVARQANIQIEKTRDKSYELARQVQEIVAHSVKQANISTKLKQQALQLRKSHTETARQLDEQKVQTGKLVTYAKNLSESIGAFKTNAS
jgi:methyl-accepting chemotaxis protein